MGINIFYFVLGAAFLLYGSELFIKSSMLIASGLGISPFVIGLTLGAIATSLPELIVSTIAALDNNTGITIGNVIGSNIANIGLALGLGAIVSPLIIDREKIKIDYFIMIAVSLLFVLVLGNSYVSRFEGLLFVILFAAYMLKTAMQNQYVELSSGGSSEEFKPTYIFLLFISVVFIVSGAKLLVSSASYIASVLGVSETIIGITAVALGTSLPEISVVVIGVLKSKTDISIGTVIGSNIINILLITGIVGIIIPIKITESAVILQALVMVLFSLFLMPFYFSGKVNRLSGFLFSLIYIIYIYLLF